MKRFFLPLVLVGALLAFFFVRGPQWTTPLAAQLVSTNDTTRNIAFGRLNRIDETAKKDLIEPLLAYLKESQQETRRFALYSLRALNLPDERIGQAAIEALKDSSEMVRQEAVIVVGNLGPSFVPELVKILSNVEKPVQDKLINSFNISGKTIVPQLISTLNENNIETQRNAALVLWSLGEKAEKARPDLLRALNDSDQKTAHLSALALSRIDPQNKQILPFFQAMIKKKEWDWMSYEALKGIGLQGEKGLSLVPDLEKQLKARKDGFGEGPYPKPALALALQQVQPRSTTLAGLSWDLKHKRPWVRYRAAWFVSEMDPPNRGLVPPLVKAAQDKDVFVHARAVYALGQIGLDKARRFHKTLIPVLKERLKNPPSDNQIEGYVSMAQAVFAQLKPANQ